MAQTVLWELAAFGVYFLYGSYFEWFLHRYILHTKKYLWSRLPAIADMFRKHTLVHHQIYKGDDTYYTEEEHPEKVAMDWWALLVMVAIHLPFFYVVQRITHIPSLWGGVAAIVVYYGLYESLHWVMHVPRAVAYLWRFRWFRFLDAHHKVHHKYMLSNLNVILPLADLTFGTLRDKDGNKIRLSGKLTRKEKTNAGSILKAEIGSGQAEPDHRRPGAPGGGAGRPDQREEPVPAGRP